MNRDEGTGADLPVQRHTITTDPFAYESVSGDRWAPGIETPGSRCTGEARRRAVSEPAAKPAIPSRRTPDRAVRKRRPYLKACLDDLERVRNGQEDPILRGNSLADVKNHLQALWELVEGSPESEAFEEMVNVLQVALCVESPEALTPGQLEGVRSVLVKMHEDPDVDDQTANDLTQELIRSGVDVFREIG